MSADSLDAFPYETSAQASSEAMRRHYWATAIGLQAMDGLEVSPSAQVRLRLRARALKAHSWYSIGYSPFVQNWLSMSLKRSGASMLAQWPAPSTTTTELSGSAAAQVCTASSSMGRSCSPQPMSSG